MNAGRSRKRCFVVRKTGGVREQLLDRDDPVRIARPVPRGGIVIRKINGNDLGVGWIWIKVRYAVHRRVRNDNQHPHVEWNGHVDIEIDRRAVHEHKVHAIQSLGRNAG